MQRNKMADMFCNDSLSSQTFLLDNTPSIASDSAGSPVDVPTNDYEELPGSRYNYADAERPAPPPMFNKLVSTTGSSSSEQLFRTAQPFYRKRENPLYESGEKETTDLQKAESPVCISILCIAVILLAVFSLTALILAILIVSGQLQPGGDPVYAQLISPLNSSQLEATLQRIAQLEQAHMELQDKHEQLQGLYDMLHSNYSDMTAALVYEQTTLMNRSLVQGEELVAEVSSLHKETENNTKSLNSITTTVLQQQQQIGSLLNSSSAQKNELESQNQTIHHLSLQLEQLKNAATIQDLQVVQQNLSVQSTTLNNAVARMSTMDQKLMTFSSYHGVVNQSLTDLNNRMVNLSRCESKVFTSEATGPRASTTLYPISPVDKSSWDIIGVTCSSTNVKSTTLVKVIDSPPAYKCDCIGIIEGSAIACYMHVWQCPRIRN